LRFMILQFDLGKAKIILRMVPGKMG